MEILKDWVFTQRKIITPKIMTSLSSLNIDSASDLLYEFYLKHKESLSAMFLVTKLNQKSNSISTDRMTQEELLTLIGSKPYQQKILSIKIGALSEKRSSPLTLQDISNTEEYELNNKDSKFQKLRFLDIEEKSKIFASQHSIVKSQMVKTEIANPESAKKTYFSRSNTQNTEKDISDLSRQSSREIPPHTQEAKKSKRDSFEVIPEDDDGFSRKSKRTKKSTPITKEIKVKSTYIELE